MILITGGMGFIGLHTAKSFVDAGEDVVITQWHARREPDFIKEQIGKSIFVEQLDVRDAGGLRQVVKKHNVTGIVHLAVPGLNALDPGEEFRTNMEGLVNILEAGKEAGMKRVSLGSSQTVYQGVREGPFREDMPLPVTSPGSTPAYKKAFETLGLLYGGQTGLDVISLRIGGPYGPLYHSMASLISRICHAAARGEEPKMSGRGGVPFEEDENDFCYVKDTAAGIQLLQMAGTLPNRIYNIGSGQVVTMRQVVDAVGKAAPGATVPLQPGRNPQMRPNAHMDISRIKQDVGFEAQYTAEAGLADYIDWLLKNPQ